MMFDLSMIAPSNAFEGGSVGEAAISSDADFAAALVEADLELAHRALQTAPELADQPEDAEVVDHPPVIECGQGCDANSEGETVTRALNVPVMEDFEPNTEATAATFETNAAVTPEESSPVVARDGSPVILREVSPPQRRRAEEARIYRIGPRTTPIPEQETSRFIDVDGQNTDAPVDRRPMWAPTPRLPARPQAEERRAPVHHAEENRMETEAIVIHQGFGEEIDSVALPAVESGASAETARPEQIVERTERPIAERAQVRDLEATPFVPEGTFAPAPQSISHPVEQVSIPVAIEAARHQNPEHQSTSEMTSDAVDDSLAQETVLTDPRTGEQPPIADAPAPEVEAGRTAVEQPVAKVLVPPARFSEAHVEQLPVDRQARAPVAEPAEEPPAIDRTAQISSAQPPKPKMEETAQVDAHPEALDRAPTRSLESDHAPLQRREQTQAPATDAQARPEIQEWVAPETAAPEATIAPPIELAAVQTSAEPRRGRATRFTEAPEAQTPSPSGQRTTALPETPRGHEHVETARTEGGAVSAEPGPSRERNEAPAPAGVNLLGGQTLDPRPDPVVRASFDALSADLTGGTDVAAATDLGALLESGPDLLAVPRTLGRLEAQPATYVPTATQTVEAEATEVMDYDVRAINLDADDAEVVLGSGDDRLALKVSTDGNVVSVAARAASANVVQALEGHSGELRQSLEQGGMQLGDFDAREETPAEERQEQRGAQDNRSPKEGQEPARTLRRRRIMA